MTLSDAVRVCLTQKYATFSGRASRSEYWWFMGAYLFFGMGVGLLGQMAQLLFVLAMICPLAAAGARRLQDTGRPGALIFVPLGLALLFAWVAPGVASQGATPGVQPVEATGVLLAFVMMLTQMMVAIVFLWWLTRPSDRGANRFGPPPAATPQEV